MTQSNILFVEPQIPHKGPAPRLPGCQLGGDEAWYEEICQAPEMRCTHFLFVAESHEKDYNVRVQHPILSLVSHGKGVLSKEAAKFSVVSTVTLGIPQELHISPIRNNLSLWRDHMDDVLGVVGDGEGKAPELPEVVKEAKKLIKALAWNTPQYFLAWAELVHHLLEVEGMASTSVSRLSGSKVCRLVALPCTPPIPESVANETFDAVWQCITEVEGKSSASVPVVTEEMASILIQKVDGRWDEAYRESWTRAEGR